MSYEVMCYSLNRPQNQMISDLQSNNAKRRRESMAG